MRVVTIYDDEREDIIIYVSAYDMQGQTTKANYGQIRQSSRRAFHWTPLHWKQTNADFPDKNIAKEKDGHPSKNTEVRVSRFWRWNETTV